MFGHELEFEQHFIYIMPHVCWSVRRYLFKFCMAPPRAQLRKLCLEGNICKYIALYSTYVDILIFF